MMRINRKILIDLAGIGVVIAALVYLLFTLGLFELLTDRSRLFDLINKHRANAVFIFIGLQILQVVAAPIPGEVSGFVGGMFFGKVWGILFSTIGLTLGSWLSSWSPLREGCSALHFSPSAARFSEINSTERSLPWPASALQRSCLR